MAELGALDATLVTVGQPVEGGAAFVSFEETPIFPTDAVTAMSTLSDFSSIGELSENGFTEGISLTSTDFEGWHGNILLSVKGKEKRTYKLELLEVGRETVAKLRYGSKNVTATDGVVTKIVTTNANDDEVALVFDELESNGYLRRTIIRRAKVTSMDDVPHQRGQLMAYGMEFTVLEPAGSASAIEIYRAKPAAV